MVTVSILATMVPELMPVPKSPSESTACTEGLRVATLRPLTGINCEAKGFTSSWAASTGRFKFLPVALAPARVTERLPWEKYLSFDFKA